MPQSIRAFGPRDTQIAERLGQHIERFVAVALGADEIRIAPDVIDHLLAVLVDLEEIIAFLDRFDQRVVGWAQVAREQFFLGIEALAADAIKPLVFLEIDIVAAVALFEHPLHELFMDLVGGADPVIETGVEADEGVVKQRAHLVGIGARRQAFGERGAADFVAMLVGAAEEGDVGASEFAPLIAGENVGGERLVSTADMRCAVAIKNRGRDVDAVAHV